MEENLVWYVPQRRRRRNKEKSKWMAKSTTTNKFKV